MKAVFTSQPMQALIAWFIASYIRLVGYTTRWHVEGLDKAEPFWARKQGVITCFWHGRLLYAPRLWPKHAQPAAILVSRSRDGDIISRFANSFGIDAIRGSSKNAHKDKDKGALKAFRDMVQQIKDGGCMAITPDGPRGPRMRAASGTVRLAKTSKATILPFSWSSTHARQLNSWDHMLLPLPFGKGVIIYGEPIELPDRLDTNTMDSLQAQLESELTQITQRADALCGRTPVEPA